MAEVAPEKSRGQKFAEQQLLRHGWKQGDGLGRNQDGISEAIKVKVKCNKGGVGHKEGEQFTFHWWDHVFNKASSSLQVESDQDGIKVRKTVEDEDDGVISNKKPRKAAQARAKLYGSFVKSGTLLGGREQPEPKPSDPDDGGSSSSSSSSSSDEDDTKLDLSSTTRLSDAQLVKACGGRTAHKGARHGLTMSAKLARLEQQEAEFMAKYGKKESSQSQSSAAAEGAEPAQEETQSKKKKKKKEKERSGVDEQTEVCESPEADVKPKKKKKKETVVEISDDVIGDENGEEGDRQETKRKSEEAEEQEEKKKKRKKRRKETNGAESSQSEPTSEPASVTNQRKAPEEEEEEVVQEEKSTRTNKRTKSEKVKAQEQEGPAPQKKKKKKKKSRD